MIRRIIVPFVIILLGVFGFVGLVAKQPQVIPNAAEPYAITVRAIRVANEPVQLTVPSQGSVTPLQESELIPEVAGRVSWLSPALVPGGSFKVGDPLLRIEDADYRASVERARANLSRARADAEHARFDFNRFRQLQQRQLASASQTENALRTQRVADAALRDARVALEQAERDLTRSTITAPFDGLVRNERVDLGQFVNRGTSVATIYASEAVEVRLPIADEQLAYLDLPFGHQGQLDPATAPAVKLTARFGGKLYTWQGQLTRTEAEIDASTRMVNVVARLIDEPGKPRPSVGMFVQAEITGRIADDIVTLPRTALRNDNQVLIVDADNRLFHRKIEPMRFYQDQVLIASGLKTGETVCVSAIQTVIDGMLVKPRYENLDGSPIDPKTTDNPIDGLPVANDDAPQGSRSVGV